MVFDLKSSKNERNSLLILSFFSLANRGVVPGGAGGSMAPLNFGRSVNPLSIKRGRLCPPNNTGTPEFSDLPTALANMLLIVSLVFWKN